MLQAACRLAQPWAARPGRYFAARPRAALIAAVSRGPKSSSHLPARDIRSPAAPNFGYSSKRFEVFEQRPLVGVRQVGAVQMAGVAVPRLRRVEQPTRGVGLRAIGDKPDPRRVVDVVPHAECLRPVGGSTKQI